MGSYRAGDQRLKERWIHAVQDPPSDGPPISVLGQLRKVVLKKAGNVALERASILESALPELAMTLEASITSSQTLTRD